MQILPCMHILCLLHNLEYNNILQNHPTEIANRVIYTHKYTRGVTMHWIQICIGTMNGLRCTNISIYDCIFKSHKSFAKKGSNLCWIQTEIWKYLETFVWYWLFRFIILWKYWNILIVSGEMLKFLQSICAVAALGLVTRVSGIPMDMETVTTNKPEATTEDTSGRLLSLPDPVKCANSKYFLLQSF